MLERRREGDVDEGKSLNARNNNAAGDKTGMEWKQARSRTAELCWRCWKSKTLRNEGFARPNKPAPVINAVLEWNSGCLSSPFRFECIHTRTHIRVDYGNGAAN